MGSKELLALRLLIDNPNGLYGSECVALSNGKLGRGSIYTLLDRLVDEGFVKETVDPPRTSYLAQRTRHTISAAGRRAYAAFLKEQGLSIIEGVFAHRTR